MQIPSSLLFMSVSSIIVYGDETSCQDRVDIQPTKVLEQQYLVRLNNQECGNSSSLGYMESYIFCEDSGWGDEEATVVCRSEMNTTFGLGGFIKIADVDTQVGFSHVTCIGSEEQLEDCEVGNLTSYNCSYLATAHCLDVTQVLVSRNESYHYFKQVEIPESEEVESCVIVWGPLSDPLHVLVETIDGLAVADYDYRPLRENVTFAPTESFRSHQCLQIEVIDDSLAEFWEGFSVTLSTNSSAVNLTRHEFNVFIEPNDGRCTEGSITVSNDADNGSLKLVEMCQKNMSVWSPLCDSDWTPQDATVICRELGYQDPDRVTYETIKRVSTIAGTPTNISCEGNETALRDCTSTELPPKSACQLLLVDCSPDITVGDPTVETVASSETPDVGPGSETEATSATPEDGTRTNNNTTSGGPDDKDNSASVSTGGVIAGVVVIILLALVAVAVVVVIVVCLRRKAQQMASTSKQVNINQLYESQDGMFAARQEVVMGEGEKHLDNPVYGLGKNPEVPQSEDGEPEHHLENPLYSLAEVERPQPKRDIYSNADPEYAVPEKEPDHQSANSSHNGGRTSPAYEYAENI